MKIIRKMKRSTKQYLIVASICIIVIGGAAAFTSIILMGQVKGEYQTLLDEAYSDMEANQRNVYVTTEDIFAGDVIKPEKVERRKVYSSQPQATYITEDEIGKLALIEIPAGTQILNTMVTANNVTTKLRETEYQVISMNSNINVNDTVDIRIFYPNGESYVVLAKKVIKAYTQDTASVFLWLEEEELLRMSAAIVDASLYTGAKLYVTKYIEPNIQEASAITYIPSLSILSLIENDPNIVERCSQELNKEIRKALENRLASNMSLDVSAINWGVNPNTSYFPKENIEEKTELEKKDEVEEKDKVEVEDEAETSNEAPTEAPQADTNTEINDNENELGSETYFYYAAKDTKEGDIEYGE